MKKVATSSSIAPRGLGPTIGGRGGAGSGARGCAARAVTRGRAQQEPLFGFGPRARGGGEEEEPAEGATAAGRGFKARRPARFAVLRLPRARGPLAFGRGLAASLRERSCAASATRERPCEGAVTLLVWVAGAS